MNLVKSYMLLHRETSPQDGTHRQHQTCPGAAHAAPFLCFSCSRRIISFRLPAMGIP